MSDSKYLRFCKLSQVQQASYVPIVPLKNIEHQVFIAKDGNKWVALIGPDLQAGTAGFGDTIADALLNLAGALNGKL